MNAKQLYIALASNSNTNTVFDGIYSIDTLKDIKNKPELIICNTDPSDKPGEHWVLFFFDESNSVDFYDSLGKDITYYGPEFIDFVNKFAENYNQCMEKTQPINTSLCGQYCLYYALCKSQHYSMQKIVNSMTSSKNVLDLVHERFIIICPMYNCPLLQKCIKC